MDSMDPIPTDFDPFGDSMDPIPTDSVASLHLSLDNSLDEEQPLNSEAGGS